MSKPAIKILVDHSGSMDSLKNSAAEAIENFIKERRTVGDNPWVSLSEFSDQYSTVYAFNSIHEVPSYVLKPLGMTALNDAIARAVKDLDEFKPDKKKDRYLVIMTDGMENASREHTKESIAALLKDRQDNKGWKVIYLGANQDAVAVGKSYSIPESASMEWRGGRGLSSATMDAAWVTSSPAAYASGFSYNMRSAAMDDDAED